MMKTKLSQLQDVPVKIGLPSSLANPIKPERFAGKREAQLAKAVAITQFGVNHVELAPGAISSLRHWHEHEDEFVFVLSGELTLIDENGEHSMVAGSFAGFPASLPNAHHLANKSKAPAAFIVVGTRKRGEEIVHYPYDPVGPVSITRDETGARIPT